MEKLNEYLQTLISSCSDELKLEPNKNPYLVSENRTTDLAHMPLIGTQISTMVFPLIPADVKSTLPNNEEVDFVVPHNLGDFNFTVQKSPAGFVVTIRPITRDSGTVTEHEMPAEAPEYPEPIEMPMTRPSIEFEPMDLTPLDPAPAYQFESIDPEPVPALSFDLENAAHELDRLSNGSENAGTLADLVLGETSSVSENAAADGSDAGLEIVSVADHEFDTHSSEFQPSEQQNGSMPGEYSAAMEAPQFETFSSPAAFDMDMPQSTYTEQTPYTPPPSSASAAFVTDSEDSGEAAKMDVMFRKMAELGASDLHLSSSMPPMVRKDGKMAPLEEGHGALTKEVMRELLTSIMPPKNQEEFAVRHDSDFAYEIPDVGRFRCNVFMDRKGMGGVFRLIPSKIMTAEDLGLSNAIMDLCSLSKGLVVITGPTGCGKSTTLCAMVDSINKTREDHIITIEDPIEFVHESQKCLVNQREVHNHTDSFKDALRAALREDPDIVLVGEMRDLDTVSIAIETAETGHLVFGTLHTTTAASTVDRIIDQFPPDRQQQIRVMLSESLKGVVAQTLLPKKGGGRIAALEVLIVTPAISNLIREGKTFQIPSAMQTGKVHGMVMLNEALFELVQNGMVEPRDAYIKAIDKTGFETMLTRGGFNL